MLINHSFFFFTVTFTFLSLSLFLSSLQLDSSDEQAAAIRRELDGRVQKCNEMEKVRQIVDFKKEKFKFIFFFN